MSEPPEPLPVPPDPEAEEVVDGLPVVMEVRALDPVAEPGLPAVQAAAAAATGFVAGVAALTLIQRRHARRLARAHRRGALDGLPVIGSGTFLVDVRLLGSRGDR